MRVFVYLVRWRSRSPRRLTPCRIGRLVRAATPRRSLVSNSQVLTWVVPPGGDRRSETVASSRRIGESRVESVLCWRAEVVAEGGAFVVVVEEPTFLKQGTTSSTKVSIPSSSMSMET